MSETINLTVVNQRRGFGIRCVYLNNYRIAGAKPYVSENLPQSEFSVSLENIRRAGFVPVVKKSLTTETNEKAISPDAAIAWLETAAQYFEKLSTQGEDRAFWSNTYNAENARKIAALVAARTANGAQS